MLRGRRSPPALQLRGQTLHLGHLLQGRHVALHLGVQKAQARLAPAASQAREDEVPEVGVGVLQLVAEGIPQGDGREIGRASCRERV